MAGSVFKTISTGSRRKLQPVVINHSPGCARSKFVLGEEMERQRERGWKVWFLNWNSILMLFHSTPGRRLSLHCLSVPLCECYFKSSIPMDRSIHTESTVCTLPTAAQRGGDEKCALHSVLGHAVETSLQRVLQVWRDRELSQVETLMWRVCSDCFLYPSLHAPHYYIRE